MYKALIVFLLVAGAASAAEIRGTVQIAGKPTGSVQVSYEALTATGEKITNMAGVTLGDGAASAWCDTYAPRRTGLKWDPQSGLSFEHTKLPAGKYVVAVKHGNFLDWKVVDVAKDSSIVNVTLALDPQQAGKLRVQINKGVGDYEVVLVPAGADGKPPVAGLDLGDSFHLRLSADVTKGDTARFDGVKPGRCQVTLSAAKRFGSDATGWSAMLTVIGTTTVTIEAGKEATVEMP